jgi:glycosyltransferase involved in cell wall biosynthesis
VSAARNTGFAHIGDLPYVCFLDSDDLWPRDFIAEGLRALEGREDIVASVANRVKQRGGKRRQVDDVRAITSNSLLWILFNGGAILSCTMIRSSAARAAGLFDPGMLVRQDSDFFLRLFSLGGAAQSMADPVLFIKDAPLEPTEPPNNSRPSLEFKYESALDLTASVSKLSKDVLKNHEFLIRTAVARRWASVASSSLKARRRRLAFNCLIRTIWWDYEWKRRLRLIWSFFRGQTIANYFPNPFEV